MERDAWKPRTPARVGGKAARLESRQRRMLCREFHPVNSKGGCDCREFYPAPAKGGGCCHHFSGGAPARRSRNRGWGSRRGARGRPGPSGPIPAAVPRSPPRRRGLPVPRPPRGVGRAAGRGRGGGTGGCGRFLPPPPPGQSGAERGGSSARPGPAERRSRAEPNFPGGSRIRTYTHTYIDI